MTPIAEHVIVQAVDRSVIESSATHGLNECFLFW
jgi:hypothetical protein